MVETEGIPAMAGKVAGVILKMSDKIRQLEQQVSDLSFAVERLTAMVSKVSDDQARMTDALTIKTLRKLQQEQD